MTLTFNKILIVFSKLIKEPGFIIDCEILLEASQADDFPY